MPVRIICHHNMHGSMHGSIAGPNYILGLLYYAHACMPYTSIRSNDSKSINLDLRIDLDLDLQHVQIIIMETTIIGGAAGGLRRAAGGLSSIVCAWPDPAC